MTKNQVYFPIGETAQHVDTSSVAGILNAKLKVYINSSYDGENSKKYGEINIWEADGWSSQNLRTYKNVCYFVPYELMNECVQHLMDNEYDKAYEILSNCDSSTSELGNFA